MRNLHSGFLSLLVPPRLTPSKYTGSTLVNLDFGPNIHHHQTFSNLFSILIHSSWLPPASNPLLYHNIPGHLQILATTISPGNTSLDTIPYRYSTSVEEAKRRSAAGGIYMVAIGVLAARGVLKSICHKPLQQIIRRRRLPLPPAHIRLNPMNLGQAQLLRAFGFQSILNPQAEPEEREGANIRLPPPPAMSIAAQTPLPLLLNPLGAASALVQDRQFGIMCNQDD